MSGTKFEHADVQYQVTWCMHNTVDNDTVPCIEYPSFIIAKWVLNITET